MPVLPKLLGIVNRASKARRYPENSLHFSGALMEVFRAIEHAHFETSF
jgi:hypothetical protein